jgi:hypothetical protein
MKLKRILLAALLTAGLATSTKATTIFTDNFDGYADGILPTQPTTPSATWTNHSGAGGIPVSSGKLYDGQTFNSDISAFVSGHPYVPISPSASATNIFYATFTVNFQALPTGSGGYYFFHFKDDGTANFRARVFAFTNTAGSGSFRLGIANGAGTASATNTTDLSPGTTYIVVVRYFNTTNTFAAPISTLWINPTSETDPSVTATDSTTPISVTTIAVRQPGSTTTPTAGAATVAIDDLVVGTTFPDVVSGSLNSPTVLVQPGDTNVFAGATVTLGTFAAGDPTVTYQWYYNTNTFLTDNGTSIAGSASNLLTLTNLSVGQSGTYSCVVSNSNGTNITRFANLIVSPTPIPPSITNEPVDVTTTIGDTASLTVGATGLPTPFYQWKYITNNGVSFITNNVAGPNITGTNSSTLTISNILSSQAGQYFCTLTNIGGYKTTNTTVATITVNPIPILTIAQFRSRVDTNYAPTNTTSLFTLQGTVTTWADMTGVANTEFYMQDASGGIAVFWSGANGTTNLPPAGAIVKVTGPMSTFSGLLEIAPVFTNSLHSVTVLSTNNPLPAPQPLPFDPNITNNLAVMKAMESMYFVASNVTFAPGATFTSGANEPISNNALHVQTFSDTTQTVSFTNDVGQTFTFFVNGSSDIPGKAKPTGPVTIFGIMGYFTAAGFEFTPSRYADIISYSHATNVLSNLTRLGDAPTNNFNESVLRPGETLTTTVTVGDPENGIVTLTPVTDGLPASASWSDVTSGPNATAVFHFSPTNNDAGTNYVITVNSSSTSGSQSTYSMYVYVPTAQEQQVYIGEFLANTTTNVNLPHFNPLHRANDTNNVLPNDQFVEIANRSGTDLDLYGWSITDASTRRHTFQIGAPNEQLAASSSNAVVVYGGGPKINDPSLPQLPVPSFPANVTVNLGIPFSGGGVIVLRNPGYYNNGLGLQPGYIVDRIVYQASDISSNGSLSRIPGADGRLKFVAQAAVNTNATTAGLQYDGSTYLVAPQMPKGVTNATVVAGNPLKIMFTANAALTTTLWQGNEISGPYLPIAGGTSGVFNITNPPTSQFYFLTTQTNY